MKTPKKYASILFVRVAHLAVFWTWRDRFNLSKAKVDTVITSTNKTGSYVVSRNGNVGRRMAYSIFGCIMA